jgi:hypothetical protein
MRNLIGAVFLLWFAGACGGDSGGGAVPGSDASVASYDQGTCDASAVPTIASCAEAKGSAIDVAANHTECLKFAGAVWSANPCPTANLIGCCSYTLGPERRECFYPRANRTIDPETYCTTSTFDGKAGVWTGP